eukprot:CAMPEP_0174717174 /NCGR_PEP_ID=MMETSP1094-20130205/26100_1 /TAXON_ID=156173 /ORGANISM="Chrysochromulina brevifilum, Strain UTEX LB 985" /LENGTH=82 /DNA_ID=CAMNT_0015917075 /DNA_START=284 /DNA_END=531 /DNA_ORIENTATION=-
MIEGRAYGYKRLGGEGGCFIWVDDVVDGEGEGDDQGDDGGGEAVEVEARRGAEEEDRSRMRAQSVVQERRRRGERRCGELGR